jgi:hypothetical protein|tara:strand:- start:1369 stop:2172 length:804 start_codon:yes stop_codon:yes gene_type:complete
MSEIKIYCVTDKVINFLSNTNYQIGWVGTETPPKNYILSNDKDNIFFKEKYYSELTFHYWFWKNLLDTKSNDWIGFCQKRRYWIKKKSVNLKIDETNIYENLISNIEEEWNGFNAVICSPVSLNKVKKVKMIKRGFRSLISNPAIFFDEKKQSINFHFDMHHGYGNLKKAIDVMNDNDREEFRNYVNTSYTYNPNIMFIAKPLIIDKWFTDLFSWLFECEKIFGFENLKGYDTQRLYAYLAERYLSFWFKKYSKSIEWPWTFIDFKG